MNNIMKSAVAALAVASLAGSALAAQVAGKVVAVSHEKVQVGTAWHDKISVTVDSCDAPGTLVTVTYAPATVSDRTALGHLFDQDLTSARTANMKAQNMPNGYGIFWVDATNKVLRTGLLGSPADCSHVPQLVKQFP